MIVESLKKVYALQGNGSCQFVLMFTIYKYMCERCSKMEDDVVLNKRRLKDRRCYSNGKVCMFVKCMFCIWIQNPRFNSITSGSSGQLRSNHLNHGNASGHTFRFMHAYIDSMYERSLGIWLGFFLSLACPQDRRSASSTVFFKILVKWLSDRVSACITSGNQFTAVKKRNKI